jgi:hypothetical protein
MWDFLESGRDVVPHIDWLFAESTAELRYVRNGGMVQIPQIVFVESFNALGQTDLDAIREQIILA